ncbi:hypothetical protein C2845_PM10G10060 [Panicum miliaceum]|uniref:Uncharacterized protein n=1 Tax=Panicum miliaceum TaxID=4540 RepID=A0A3L6PJW7_PANMI|nr:hypothetical protein C2845_PM10G10060 [Panicum miliaceum]
MEEVEEDPEEIYFFVQTQDGHIMVVDSEGNLRTPTPSPTPASPTPAADARSHHQSLLLLMLQHLPLLVGTRTTPGMTAATTMRISMMRSNPQKMTTTTTTMVGARLMLLAWRVPRARLSPQWRSMAPFPTLLQDVLLRLGNTLRPLHVTNHISEPGRDDYYITRVHIQECLGIAKGMRTISAHDSTAPHTTYAAAISNVARRALWSLCHTHRLELSFTDYCHLSRRTSGTEETVVVIGEDGEDRINILARVTAALNTDLEGATVELARAQEMLLGAQARIAQLEAQLSAKEPPPAQDDEPPALVVSPPRKSLRYSAPGSITGLID